MNTSIYDSDTEQMEIVLNTKELKKDGLTEDFILSPIRNIIINNGGKELSHGVFELSGIDAFAIMGSLPGKIVKTNHDILKYFKIWNWYVDDECENCISSMEHYLKETLPIIEKLRKEGF